MTLETLLKTCGGILMIAILSFLPVQAQQDSLDLEQFKIEWQQTRFFSNQVMPQFEQTITINSYPTNSRGYYFLQFTGPIQRSQKERLTALGVELLDYVPVNTFIVRMNTTQKERAEALPFIQFVGIFQPGFRLSPVLQSIVNGELEFAEPIQDEPVYSFENAGTGSDSVNTDIISLQLNIFKEPLSRRSVRRWKQQEVPLLTAILVSTAQRCMC